MTDVVFPAMSKDDADAEGVVATWFVADGETVAAGQLIAEVAMDKVDMEVTAPAAGVVRLVIAEGGAVRQGETIASIADGVQSAETGTGVVRGRNR
jgi:pyruvate/2-oxoglutarate dehydrogenase complex dihydrolipoamide acyltransferase (E2) component